MACCMLLTSLQGAIRGRVNACWGVKVWAISVEHTIASALMDHSYLFQQTFHSPPSLTHIFIVNSRALQYVWACRAPEQADADFGIRGPHSDVWGYAATLLHLASGQLPYADLSQMQMLSAMYKRRPPDVPVSLPAWLRKMLQQCLSFDTAARPSVADLLEVGTCLAHTAFGSRFSLLASR